MMTPLMQKMAAPLALASALCHIATISVIGNMHIQLSTLWDTATGPHRALLDFGSTHDPLAMDPQLAQTVARAAALLAAARRRTANIDIDIEFIVFSHSGPLKGLDALTSYSSN